MGVDPAVTAFSGITLPIPEAGLAETLRAWSGKGQLWEAMAAIGGERLAERRWSARDIERRANRVLIAQLAPDLIRWPTDARSWTDALPAQSFRTRTQGPFPLGRTAWGATRAHGWPPRVFVGHDHKRTADNLLVTTLRWLLQEIQRIRADAVAVEPSVDEQFRLQLEVAFTLLGMEPLASAEAIPPTRADIDAFRSEGHPWTVSGAVGNELRKISESSMVGLANRLVLPSDDLRWRLFHLGVLGEFLIGMRDTGSRVTSVRPLSAATLGPAFLVVDAQGRNWDFWFEAAGVWTYYGRPSSYVHATQGVTADDRPIGADLLLIHPEGRALLAECKYSRDTGTVARQGYHQAVTYATEVRTHLALDVTAIVVGPEGVVQTPAYTDTIAGRIGVVPATSVRSLVADFLRC
jgi:hypothetical protein